MAHASAVNYAAAARAPPPKVAPAAPVAQDTRSGISLPARDTRLKTTVSMFLNAKVSLLI